MDNELYMMRALELATMGSGYVSPNPMVGCVIIHDGNIIGEGSHKKYGEFHAEVNAINSVQDHSLLPNSVLFVTLEPCSHFGKTPPCADLIIEKKIPKVVIANSDPNPLVAGKGIEKLRLAGIEVLTGVLEKEGQDLNKRFFTFYTQKRPYIILKWAQTSDGFIARENFDSKWISNEFSRMLVHKWRSEEDAVMVGYNTAFYDNPKLNVRDWAGRDPIRIAVDRTLKLPSTHNLFDQKQKTIIFNFIKKETEGNIEFAQLNPKKEEIKQIINQLYERKILSIIVEGGSEFLNAFIKEGMWDEARVFTSQKLFEKGLRTPELGKTPKTRENIFDDELAVYYSK